MADIDYPVELPSPSRSNYALQHVSPFARTDMSTGRARQRRTLQSVPSIVNLEWTMTPQEAQLFEAWFAYDIGDGADWFNIDLKTPIGDLAPYECRFTEMYSGPELFGLNQWRYSAPVEIRERPILDSGYYLNARSFVVHSDVFDNAMNNLWPTS